MTHQTASGQLKILRDMGYVSSISVGRESYYELRESLMRLSVEVKKHRGEPIRLLVDFLRLWYSRTELQQRLELLQPFFIRAQSLLALDHWEDGSTALDEALHRFATAEEPDVGDTGAILRNLFSSTRDAGTWRARIGTLIELYDKHQVASALGQGLVRSIEALNTPDVSDATAQTWRDVWRELAGDRKEFQLPLRLLDAAVRYRETQDRRVLLKLPVEERKLLEPVLGIEEPSSAWAPAPFSSSSALKAPRRSAPGN